MVFLLPYPRGMAGNHAVTDGNVNRTVTDGNVNPVDASPKNNEPKKISNIQEYISHQVPK